MSRIAPQSAFDILGVTPGDDFATIRRAWIRLVKENHPDVVGGDIEELTRKLARFNDAYDSLRWHNPDKVRIRESQEKRQAGPDRRATQRRQPDPERRQGGTADRTGPDRRSGPTAAPTGDDRRSTTPRRIEDVLSRVANPGEGVWTHLDPAEATALYTAIRNICATPPTAASARSRTCV